MSDTRNREYHRRRKAIAEAKAQFVTEVVKKNKGVSQLDAAQAVFRRFGSNLDSGLLRAALLAAGGTIRKPGGQRKHSRKPVWRIEQVRVKNLPKRLAGMGEYVVVVMKGGNPVVRGFQNHSDADRYVELCFSKGKPPSAITLYSKSHVSVKRVSVGIEK